MKKKVYNLPKTDDYVEIDALIETAYEWKHEHITFCEVFDSFYASYRPVVIRIPAYLRPEVGETPYGDKMIKFSPEDRMLFPTAQLPELRLGISGDVAYTYFDKWAGDAIPGHDPASYQVIARFPIIRKE